MTATHIGTVMCRIVFIQIHIAQEASARITAFQ